MRSYRSSSETPVTEHEQRADVERFLAENTRWVVEGWQSHLLSLVLPLSTELWFLDLPVEQCVENCRVRRWEPRKYPSMQKQDENLPTLLQWVRAYNTRDDAFSRAAHEAIFTEYAGSKVRFTERPALAPLP